MDVTRFKGKKTHDRLNGVPCIICGDTEDPVSEDGLCGWCQATVDSPGKHEMEKLALTWATHYTSVWMKRAFFAREARDDQSVTLPQGTVFQITPHAHTGELYLLGSQNDNIVFCLYIDDFSTEHLHSLALDIENKDYTSSEALVTRAFAFDTIWAKHELWGIPHTSRDFPLENR